MCVLTGYQITQLTQSALPHAGTRVGGDQYASQYFSSLSYRYASVWSKGDATDRLPLGTSSTTQRPKFEPSHFAPCQGTSLASAIRMMRRIYVTIARLTS